MTTSSLSRRIARPSCWVALVSAANIANLGVADLGSHDGTEAAILRTIAIALPCLLAAFVAVPLAQALPAAAWARTLAGARRALGLGFAAAMGWHLALVGYFFARFGYDLDLHDVVLDVIGLLFLVALTVTSFGSAPRRLGAARFRALHRSGLYVLWFLPTFFFAEDWFSGHDPRYGATALALLGMAALRGVLTLRGRRAAQ